MPRRGKTLASVVFMGTLAGVLGAVAIACGIDAVATKEFPGAQPDAPAPTEASLPPKNDAEPSDGGIDAAIDAAEAGCPTKGGAMVQVTASGTTFCIDGTEVTNAAYGAFVTATDGGAISAFDAGTTACLGNTTYAPVPPSPNGGTFPVVNVNYCDAFAYCRWAGKRLCGKRVGRDAGTGEWYAACSAGGTREFPYPGAYSATACNDKNVGVRAVATFPGCEGGVPGLFDMVSNVSELIDDCVGVSCPSVGGDYSAPGACDVTSDYIGGAGSIGFRCCADLP